MPFVSKDWRDPGENWVKTDEGWEKKKIIEYEVGAHSESDEDFANGSSGPDSDSELRPRRTQLVRLRSAGPPPPPPPPPLRMDAAFASARLQRLLRRRRTRSSSAVVAQPHCHITLKCTREIAGFNGLSEALKRLDFRNAIRDSQRFNYVCKFLDLLITNKLATLTGGVQKMLFSMLEEVTMQVFESGQNLHTLHRLLQNLQKRIEDYLWWGSTLGSVVLWERQRERFVAIRRVANSFQICQPGEDVRPTIQQIPEECVREIVARLDNHTDIWAVGEAFERARVVCSDPRLWRELCAHHWAAPQVEGALRAHQQRQLARDWEHIYHRLRRAYGLRETFASTVALCRKCHCLFWVSLGHPCLVLPRDDDDEEARGGRGDGGGHAPPFVLVAPKVFLSYFSI